MFSDTMRRFKAAITATAVVACLAITSQTEAAIMYGDYSDIPPGAVMYLNVTESSFSNSVPPALYGAPSVTGNLLDTDPNAFGVSSASGDFGLIDGQISFTLMALPGAGVTGFSIVESGDFSFAGFGSTGTFVSASAGATVSILEVDGVTLANPISVFASDLFVADYGTTGGAPTTGLLPWALTTFVDLGPYLPSGYVEGATKIDVSINNQLLTGTEPTSQAAIAKKDFKIVPIGDLDPNFIPEPATASLVLLGLASMAACRRK